LQKPQTISDTFSLFVKAQKGSAHLQQQNGRILQWNTKHNTKCLQINMFISKNAEEKNKEKRNRS